ncbi:MAG: M28 family peptidase, partial [Bdellovibrio sp.]
GSPIQTVQLSLPLKGHIEILQRISKARNTLALLKVPGAKRTLIIGAHGDHLGKGHPPSSRATSEDKDLIHYGADDNASGMAGVLELAHYFSSAYSQKLFHPKQNILFAIWSGEELGNLGSSHFVKKYKNKYHISAYLNMDMIGRFQGKLLVQGVGSSPQWPLLLEQMAAQNPLPIKALYSPYLPTDSTSFYLAQTPILNFFTGSHEDYHTPRDTADKITIPETTKVIQYIQQITEMIATKNFSLPYHKVSDIAPSPRNKGFRTYLGTIPDYTQDNIQGVALSGVINNGPAQKAGLKKGDIIVELGNTPIRSIYDYVASLKALVPGKKTEIVVLRNHKKLKLSITPLLR